MTRDWNGCLIDYLSRGFPFWDLRWAVRELDPDLLVLSTKHILQEIQALSSSSFYSIHYLGSLG